jgi:hypothetical protein
MATDLYWLAKPNEYTIEAIANTALMPIMIHLPPQAARHKFLKSITDSPICSMYSDVERVFTTSPQFIFIIEKHNAKRWLAGCLTTQINTFTTSGCKSCHDREQATLNGVLAFQKDYCSLITEAILAYNSAKPVM